jgi:hypothetical protein
VVRYKDGKQEVQVKITVFWDVVLCSLYIDTKDSKELFVPIFYLEDGSHKFSETVYNTSHYRRP